MTNKCNNCAFARLVNHGNYEYYECVIKFDALKDYGKKWLDGCKHYKPRSTFEHFGELLKIEKDDKINL